MTDKLRWELFAGDIQSSEIGKITTDKYPSEIYIEEGGFKLFLGAGHHARRTEVLDELRITYVLNVAAHEIRTEELYGDRYKCMRVNMEDEETFAISEHMDGALRFVDEARVNGAGILVHCAAGVSRSATVVIAYLMSYHKWPLKKTANYVYQRRPWIYPNSGFVAYLLEHEKTIQSHKCTVS